MHLATQVQPDIRVLWVDHGYNREATYQHAEELKTKLNLNIQAFVPKYTTAYYDAVYGGVPELTEENEEAIKAFRLFDDDETGGLPGARRVCRLACLNPAHPALHGLVVTAPRQVRSA